MISSNLHPLLGLSGARIQSHMGMRRKTFVVAAVLAACVLTGCASASAALTPRQLDRQIRACFVQRGATVALEHPGGEAHWGRPSAYRWASWSYVMKNGRVWTIIQATSSTLTPAQRRAADHCARWPR